VTPRSAGPLGEPTPRRLCRFDEHHTNPRRASLSSKGGAGLAKRAPIRYRKTIAEDLAQRRLVHVWLPPRSGQYYYDWHVRPGEITDIRGLLPSFCVVERRAPACAATGPKPSPYVTLLPPNRSSPRIALRPGTRVEGSPPLGAPLTAKRDPDLPFSSPNISQVTCPHKYLSFCVTLLEGGASATQRLICDVGPVTCHSLPCSPQRENLTLSIPHVAGRRYLGTWSVFTLQGGLPRGVHIKSVDKMTQWWYAGELPKP